MAEIADFEAKKRQIIKKKKRAKAKRRLIVFLFLFICVGIIFTVLKAPVFNIKGIMCVGQQELSEEDVIRIAGAKTGVNIFTTGVKIMKRNLAENPLIAESNVRRIFPDKIKIWVREAKPVLMAEMGSSIILADKNGQIIKTVEKDRLQDGIAVAKLNGFEPASNVPGESIYKKDDAVHSKISECAEILQRLEMLEKVTMISASDLSDIRIDYEDRLNILLGDYQNMDYRLTFVKKVISENLSKFEKAVLDYRGKNLYVGPKNEEQQNTDDEQSEAATEGESEGETAEPADGEQKQTEEQKTENDNPTENQ